MPSQEAQELETCATFHVISLTMPPVSIISDPSLQQHIAVPATTTKSIIHHLFVRPHVSRKDNFPQNKTLFLVNIPVDATLSHFKRLFRHCGTISKFIQNENYSGASGHIIFDDIESVSCVLEMRKRIRLWVDPNPTPIGLSKYISMFDASQPPISELKERVDTYMEEFTEMERSIREDEELLRNMPDEDGFVKVMRRSKKSNTDGAVIVQPLRIEDANKLKPKDLALSDFYRFQARDTKGKQMAELRKVFLTFLMSIEI
jgi:ribosomal RNA-processing protein 7